MKRQKKTSNKRPEHMKVLVFIFLFNLLVIVLGLALQQRLPPEIPLFYGEPTGEAQLASRIFIILPSTIAVLVTILNLAIYKLIEENFLRDVLIGIAVATTVLSSITTVKIATLVGNIL